MTTTRLTTLAALAALLVSVATACAAGGGGGTSTGGVAGTQATKTSTSPAQEKQRIRHVWTRFFSSQTSPSTKASLLQNGQQFSSAIQAQSKSPLANESAAMVSNVQLEGPRKAKVTYTITLAGKPALKHQTGTAVKQNGSWKVGDRSFCSLLQLGGKAPSACPSGG